MITPRYKEHGSARARRLRIFKPHIYWSRVTGHWVAAVRGGPWMPENTQARAFCIDQDQRWTPRQEAIMHVKPPEVESFAALCEAVDRFCRQVRLGFPTVAEAGRNLREAGMRMRQ